MSIQVKSQASNPYPSSREAVRAGDSSGYSWRRTDQDAAETEPQQRDPPFDHQRPCGNVPGLLACSPASFGDGAQKSSLPQDFSTRLANSPRSAVNRAGSVQSALMKSQTWGDHSPGINTTYNATFSNYNNNSNNNNNNSGNYFTTAERDVKISSLDQELFGSSDCTANATARSPDPAHEQVIEHIPFAPLSNLGTPHQQPQSGFPMKTVDTSITQYTRFAPEDGGHEVRTELTKQTVMASTLFPSAPPPLFTSGSQAPSGKRSLKICTVNVLFEDYYARFCEVSKMTLDDRTRHFESWLAEALEENDVVCFQEWPYSGEMAGVWNSILDAGASRWRHTVFRQDDARMPADGIVVCVKTPWTVIDMAVRQFTQRTSPHKRYGTFLIENGEAPPARIGVINAHVPFSTSVQQNVASVREVYSLADPLVTDKWVAVGDFNTEAGAMFNASGLPQGWVDATKQLLTTTCASPGGYKKIDYVTTSPAFTLANIRAHPPDASDTIKHIRCPDEHKPVSWFSDHTSVSAILEF
eukprot:gene515-777_t